jgi:hypothetical protein
MRRGDTAGWSGLRLLGHQNSEALAFPSCSSWDGLSRCVGCGCRKTEPDRPWAAFQIQVHPAVKAFFRVAIVLEVGNGNNTIFWIDRWLHGQSLDQLVPTLFGSVNNKARKRSVYEALTEMKWVQDIRVPL